MKIKISADQLDAVFLSIQKQISPFTNKNLKLFKTLKKIVILNTEVIIPSVEKISAEKEVVKEALLEKLVFLRRELPVIQSLSVQAHYEKTISLLQMAITENVSTNACMHEPHMFKELDFPNIREINENMPSITSKFKKAISVIEDAGKNENIEELSPEDVAFMYFYNI